MRGHGDRQRRSGLGAKQALDADALELRLPGVAKELSQSPGIDFVLARSADGPVCFRHGNRYRFRESGGGIFKQRGDAALVIEGVESLMKMPSAGDLVIYGI